MEKWKAIPGYEGIYEASDLGKIRTVDGKITWTKRHGFRSWKSRVLKFKSSKTKRRNDYHVTLWKNGKSKDFLVSRLIASSWIRVPFEGETVNHINGDWTDNRPQNLEWVSLSENIKKGFETGLYSSNMRPVFFENGEKFKSMADAGKYLGKGKKYICGLVARGKNDAKTESGQTLKFWVGDKGA